jgi:hypothetical protein
MSAAMPLPGSPTALSCQLLIGTNPILVQPRSFAQRSAQEPRRNRAGAAQAPRRRRMAADHPMRSTDDRP